MVPLLAVPLGGGERRQERQRPDMARPRDGREQLQRDPAQPAYLDEVAVTRADGVAVDAGCGDLGPASPFDRFVDAHDERARGRKRRNEQPEEDPTRPQARPDRTVEYAMIPLELREIPQADSPQRGTAHPSPWRQDGPSQEHLDMAPHGAREQRREWRQECHNVCGEELHRTTSFQEWSLAYPPFPFAAEWTKSSYEMVSFLAHQQVFFLWRAIANDHRTSYIFHARDAAAS